MLPCDEVDGSHTGKRLRRLRESVGLTLTEVERLTRELANKRRNPRLAIPMGRLSETEMMGGMPSVHTLYSSIGTLGYTATPSVPSSVSIQ